MKKYVGIYVILLCVVIILAAGCTSTKSTGATSTQITTTAQPQPNLVLTTSASSSSCSALVEGKYTTRVSDFATFETIGDGKAKMVVSGPNGKEGYAISYSLRRSDKPCEGLYNWKGFTDKNVPVSGNFGIIGKNPDKIMLYNDADAANNNDKGLEFLRIDDVTVFATPLSTVAQTQDAIIGVWRYSEPDGYDLRYQFNADGTLQVFARGKTGQKVYSHTGTWKSEGKNLYFISYQGSEGDWMYVPTSDSLYETSFPKTIYTRYQGNVKIDS